jgi:hypothetical protein
MQLDTLVTPEEATERLAAYEAQLAEERTVEDDSIRAGYRAAARGLPVISLSAAMAAGGWFPNGLPRLAVVRADATRCWVHTNSWRRQPEMSVVYCDQARDRGRAGVGRHRVEVAIPAPDVMVNRRWEAATTVPVIPPEVRPTRRRLRGFHVLWEVEAWDPTPPRDPALLRHIRGDLWTVVATWDLTELERAVLAQRASS